MDKKPCIQIEIDTKHPLDVEDLIASISGISKQYQRFIKNSTTQQDEIDTKLYVENISKNSPLHIDLVSAAAPLLGGMGAINTFVSFVNFIKSSWSQTFRIGAMNKNASNSELTDFHNTLQIIANDTNGKATISAAYFEDGNRNVRAAFTFNTQEARIAQKNILADKTERERKGIADHSKVVMTFHQTNKDEPRSDRRTGEKAVIESISLKPLPLVYASKRAGERIKSEVSSGEMNPYHLAFVVDVNVETAQGRPIAYRIINLYDVFEIDTKSEP